MAAAQKPKKPRKKMTVEEKAAAQLKRDQTRFKTNVHEIFSKSGFKFLRSEDIHFTLQTVEGDRKTELDGLYAYENILLIVEDTHKKDPADHLSKKRLFAELATKYPVDLVKCLKENLKSFEEYDKGNLYNDNDYVIRYLYFSMNSVSTEHADGAARAGITIVERALANYFNALVKTISFSAKHEIIKFLDIKYSDIGNAKITGGNSSDESKYKGFLLPENNSSYPEGYRVVSFYADPESLLKKSYVLRKNSWMNPDHSYQRIIDTKKIKGMRRYLSETKRVYVNNIIATLPSSTRFEGLESRKQLTDDELRNVRPVTISLPDEFNVVGLIDGQHRVFSYHEGTDAYETDISALRMRQNLLVTGLIYPDKVIEEERVQFEAKLFLEINDRQTKIKSALTQEIELIVNPYSTLAISRAVVSRLSRAGALKGKLEEHVFDDSKKLKISSIVSYGLKPVLKREGSDSLFNAWNEENLKADIVSNSNRLALESYIDFGYTEINKIMLAAMRSAPWQWHIDHEQKMLTPTSINGLIRCLRSILENGKPRDQEYYDDKLKNLVNFDFKEYKSSHWNQLGIKIYEKYFE